MTLYEIDERIVDALERAIDTDTGEIKDELALKELDSLQMERDDKIEGVGLWIKDLNAEAKAIKEEEAALKVRRIQTENKAENLKKYLVYALSGSKFKSPKLSISYRSSESVNISVSPFDIPEDYLRYKDPEPDKTLIKQALKEGKTINGCELVKNTNIQIR